MSVTKHYDNFFKVKKIILSCRTKDQVVIAKRVLIRFDKSLPKDSTKFIWSQLTTELIENLITVCRCIPEATTY